MSNSLLTIDMVTRKASSILENELVITRNVNRQYDDSFARSGAKIGSTLRLRLPDRVLVTDGAAIQTQDVSQQYTTLSVTSQKHVALEFTSAEQSLSLDDYTELVLKPRISQLAASVDADVANAYKELYASVGTPGTTPATSLVLLQAQQKLHEAAAPQSRRYATVDPAANAGLVEGMKGFFNPQGTISAQFKSGMMGTGVLGYDEIAMSQSITTHTTGAWGTTITSTGTLSTEGQATLPISFTGSSKTWKQGDVFTIANVYAVNPQTRRSTGSLQQFTVTADVTGSSTATLAISPAIYTATHALATVDAFPVATAVVTMLGSASTVYPQNLVYQKDAIAFVTTDLVMPQNVQGSRAVHNGISIRVIRDYDIINDRDICRLDILYGYKVIRPQLGVRMWG